MNYFEHVEIKNPIYHQDSSPHFNVGGDLLPYSNI